LTRLNTLWLSRTLSAALFGTAGWNGIVGDGRNV
jgi:hypothetical protein